MTPDSTEKICVELRAANIPWISWIAVHYWFVIHDHEGKQRWEVWQKPQQCQSSWGHLHLNLLTFDRGVGCGDSWVEKCFEGDECQRLVNILKASNREYPYQQLYRYWPGPNSNTYVQWILNQADIEHRLHPKGIGKNYLRWFG